MYNRFVGAACVIFGIYIGFTGGITTDILLSYILGGIFVLISELEKLNEHSK